MAKKILHHSRYDANAFGHGGEKRTAQINEYYKSKGFEFIDLKIDLNKKFNLKNLLKALVIIYKVHGLKEWKSINKFRKFWRDLALAIPQLETYFSQDIETFVWESVQDEYYFLNYFAKKHKKIIIAIPHNIETLVLNQKSALSNKVSPFGFDKEINILKKCHHVFTISRLDNQLLTLFGVNSNYFRYFPPKEIQLFLLAIRAKRELRQVNKIKQILILGTAHNPPTFIGMQNLLEKLNATKIENICISVAGFGTEKLKFNNTNDYLVLKGMLSKEELEVEMLNCDALLVYQPITTGALTRVIEFLIAGIPVIINSEAIHSHFDLDGVWMYDSNKKLKEVLQSNLPMPSVPLFEDFEY